jgi:hypothetical protein
MKIGPSFSRRLIPLLAALGALAALVFAVGPAGASPTTGPAIEPQSPPEGAAVAATEEGLKVTFSCPSFVFEEGEVIEEEGETEEEIEEREELEEELEEEIPPRPTPAPIVEAPVMGGTENYGVHFSTSPTVNGGGQLGTSGFGEAEVGEGEAEPIKPAKTSCVSELELPSAPVPAALYEGKIYWQAYRESEVAGDGVEVGPVRSFTVHPNVEEPELIFREQVFAGYLTKVFFGYEAELPGATVQLQELDGTTWTTIAEAPGNKAGENTFFFKPKKSGLHRFRPLVVAPGHPALPLEEETKAVRKVTKQRVTSADDDGAYIAANEKEAEESPIGFTVSGNGAILRNLTAEAETTCKGPTKAQDVHIEVAARIAGAKIAPDGTVFGVTTTKGPEAWTVTLTGSLFHGRFQGELSTSHGNCTGYRVIDAVRNKAPKT